jgi:hypothetical protein
LSKKQAMFRSDYSGRRKRYDERNDDCQILSDRIVFMISCNHYKGGNTMDTKAILTSYIKQLLEQKIGVQNEKQS